MYDIVSTGWNDAIMSQGSQASVERQRKEFSLVSPEIVELGVFLFQSLRIIPDPVNNKNCK